MNLSFRSAMSIILAGSLMLVSSVAWGADPASDVSFLNDAASMFSLILDVLYVIIWPLIVVAGWAMDNSLVLGEVFHLDKALFQFWQMMKNLANFTLGFLVLYEIASHLRGKGSEKEIVETIGKAIVAGVGIQVSRFVVIALLDISTIAIVSIGSMPLTVIDDHKNDNHRIIQPSITLNSVGMNGTNPGYGFDGKSKKFYEINYSCPFKDTEEKKKESRTYTMTDESGKPIKDKKGEKKIASCKIYNDFLVARRPDLAEKKDRETKDANGNETQQLDNPYDATQDPINYDYCVYEKKIITIANSQKKEYYYIYLDDLTKRKKANEGKSHPTPSELTGSTINQRIFAMDFSEEQGRHPREWSTKDKEKKVQTNMSDDSIFNCKTFGSLKQEATKMAGPLTTLYSSILGFAEIGVSKNNDSIGRIGVLFLIKALTGIMLIAPLVVLCVALIKRVGYLWMILIASPFIILKATFKDTKILPDDLFKHVTIEKVMGLIFMPVVTVFALSLGIVFLTSLNSTLHSNPADQQESTTLLSSLGIQEVDDTKGKTKTKCYQIFITEICFETNSSYGSGRDNFLNMFSWVIVNLFGVGVMRMIVFATFKVSDVSNELGESVQELGKNLALSAPVVPLGSKGIGLGALGVGQGKNNEILSKVSANLRNKIAGQRSSLFDKDPGKDTGKDAGGGTSSTPPPVVSAVNKVISNITPATTGGTVTAEQVAKMLNTTSQANDGKGITTKQRKDLIDHLNTSKDKKATFGNKREVGLNKDNNQEFTVAEKKTDTPQSDKAE